MAQICSNSPRTSHSPPVLIQQIVHSIFSCPVSNMFPGHCIKMHFSRELVQFWALETGSPQCCIISIISVPHMEILATSGHSLEGPRWSSLDAWLGILEISCELWALLGWFVLSLVSRECHQSPFWALCSHTTCLFFTLCHLSLVLLIFIIFLLRFYLWCQIDSLARSLLVPGP